jgi:hypothetical protein
VLIHEYAVPTEVATFRSRHWTLRQVSRGPRTRRCAVAALLARPGCVGVLIEWVAFAPRRHGERQAPAPRRVSGDCAPTESGAIRRVQALALHNLWRSKGKTPENELWRPAASGEFRRISGAVSGERRESGWCSGANAEQTQRLRQFGAPLVDTSAADAAHDRSPAKPPAFARFCATARLSVESREPFRRAAAKPRGRGVGPKRGL